MNFKILDKILTDKIPRWIVLLIDTYIATNTFVLAYLIRYNLSTDFDFISIMRKMPIVAIVCIFSFLIIKLHRGIVRYSGIKDVENVVKASSLLLLLLLLLNYSCQSFFYLKICNVSLSILLIHFLLNIIFLSLARYVFKLLYHRMRGLLKRERHIMIYGAGDAGILTSSVFKDGKEGDNKVIGFIDDDQRKAGNKINGVPIFHSSDVNSNFVDAKELKEVIISMQNVSSGRMLDIIDKYSDLNVKVKIVPPIQNWMNGVLEAKQIKEINVEDLLGRESIIINNPTLAKEFKDKVILITGAAGSIGSEIAKQISQYQYKKIVLLDMAESALFGLQQYFVSKQLDGIECIVSDVRNEKRMELLYSLHSPDIVFHASAYKHVPFMEDNPYEAVYVNVYGTKIMADLAVKYGVDKFVMISTDKAVNPTNVMGASKRIAELYVASLKENAKTKFITTRFGNVLGSNGSVIPTFKSQINQGGPLTVTHKEITRFFMTIPEACRLVLEAGAMGRGGEIFVFDMGESVKILDLAVKMIKLSGFRYPEDIDIKIIGLRPGEKIYEEVLSNEENTLPTYHKRIKIAKVKAVDSKTLQNQVTDLCEINSKMNKVEIVKKMKEILPEFVSNNSEFSKLDNNK